MKLRWIIDSFLILHWKKFIVWFVECGLWVVGNLWVVVGAIQVLYVLSLSIGCGSWDVGHMWSWRWYYYPLLIQLCEELMASSTSTVSGALTGPASLSWQTRCSTMRGLRTPLRGSMPKGPPLRIWKSWSVMTAADAGNIGTWVKSGVALHEGVNLTMWYTAKHYINQSNNIWYKLNC